MAKKHRRVEIEDLSDAAFERIGAAITNGQPLSRGLVEAAAFIYCEEKSRKDAGLGRGVRADLAHLQSSADSFATSLEDAQLQVLFRVGLIAALLNPDQADALDRIKRLVGEAKWLKQAIGDVLAMLKTPTSDLEVGTGQAIELLKIVYERATGNKPTHSAHRDGEYIGGAQSPFGRFVVAFFAEVDPTLNETTIGNMLRKRLHRTKRKH